VLTAGSNGTLVKTVIIKAITNTTHGMIRLYDYDGTNTKIIYEVEVPAITKATTDPAFEITIPMNHVLKAGNILKATTEKADTFNIIAEGLNWTYYPTMVRSESTNYTANTGMQTVSTANSNLDGTGTLSSAIVTGASNGTVIKSITIKAQVTTSKGMIRLFIYNGTTTRLIKEVPIPAITKSGIFPSFMNKVDFDGKDFSLQAGYSLKVSTEIGESFNVIVEGLDWAYPG